MMKLFENLWLKIVALILGMFIWFHVATDKTYNYELTLPIDQVDLSDSLTLAENPPESLLVGVSAPGKQLLRQGWQAQGLRLSAFSLPIGRHQLLPTTKNTFLSSSVGNITLEEIILPGQIELMVDSIGEIVVPVTADLALTADEGFAVGRPYLIEPAEVKLRGARSQLTRFGTILTERKELGGLRTDVTMKLALAAPPYYGLTISPDSVSVRLKVLPVKTRVFSNLPVILYNVPPDLKISIEPGTVDLELTGPPDEIDSLKKSTVTVSANFRMVNEFGDAPLNIDYPSTISLRKTSASRVKLITMPPEPDDADPGN